MYVVDQWSTSMSAWYQGVAGWERPARLRDLGVGRSWGNRQSSCHAGVLIVASD